MCHVPSYFIVSFFVDFSYCSCTPCLSAQWRPGPGQAKLQMLLYVRPLIREDAIHDGVTDGSVPTRAVMADDAIALGAQGFNGTLRDQVEIVGTQPHHVVA